MHCNILGNILGLPTHVHLKCGSIPVLLLNLIPRTYEINYVNVQVNYVDIRQNYVDMQHSTCSYVRVLKMQQRGACEHSLGLYYMSI